MLVCRHTIHVARHTTRPEVYVASQPAEFGAECSGAEVSEDAVVRHRGGALWKEGEARRRGWG